MPSSTLKAEKVITMPISNITNFILICSLILFGSCQQFTDKEELLLFYEKNDSTNKIVIDSIDNAVIRFDERDIIIDKHWFNENEGLYLYTMYNRYYETSKAVFIVNFNNKNEATKFTGHPFYLSSNLITQDTIKTDTVKAYMYIANSPFLKPEIKIITKNLINNEDYLHENTDPNYFIYYEDYPKNAIQNTDYCFYYTINYNKINYKDSLVFNTIIRKQQ